MSLSKLLKIPAAQSFLMSGDIFDALDQVCEKYQLPKERSEEFLDLCDAVIAGDLAFEQMPMLVVQAFGCNEDIARKIACDIAGFRLLPLENYIPGIAAGITMLGGKISDYPAFRVEKDEAVERMALQEIVDGLKIVLSDVLLKRLSFLLQQFVLGEKTEESLKTFFTRSLNIGGLGLTEEQAVALLAAILPRAKELTSAAVSPAITPVTPVVNVEAPVALTEPVHPEPQLTQELEVAPSHEVAAEVPVVNTPKPVNRKQSASSTSSKASPLKVERQPELDPNELKASAKRASVVRKLTASTQSTFASALVTATEMAAPVLKKNKISDKVFADLADKAIRGLRDIYQTRDIVERDWELKGGDLATVMQAVSAGVEAYQSLVALPNTAVKPVLQDSPQVDESQADERFSKLTKIDLQAIPQAKAELTVGSTPVVTKDGQRKVVDVVTSPRLAGPIEQLGKMSPTEFRRLSSNAAEAGQKIEDLLSTLETTSYEERVKGVLAWRESPMNQLYLQIAEEALTQGLALPEVSSRRRAAGKESLSPAEIKALALLNTKIRF